MELKNNKVTVIVKQKVTVTVKIGLMVRLLDLFKRLFRKK